MRLTAIHISWRRGVRRATPGFTLVELLLALILVLLLAGAMVFNFSNLDQGAALDEGAARLESLIRFAQASAANTGCRVQLSFPVDDQAIDSPDFLGKVQVKWEPDPLGEPGVFEELFEARTQADAVNELVLIQNVGLPGSAEAAAQTNGAPQSNVVPQASPAPQEPQKTGSSGGLDQAMQDYFTPLVFNPDGSSDSAEIVVVAREPNGDRRLVLRLEGITGAVSSELLLPPEDQELDAFWEEETGSTEPPATSKDTLTIASPPPDLPPDLPPPPSLEPPPSVEPVMPPPEQKTPKRVDKPSLTPARRK